MKIWLQSLSKFNTLAQLDIGTGQYALADRRSLGAAAPGKGDEIFALLGGTLVAIYPLNGQVIFRLGADAFALDDHTVVVVSGPDHARALRVVRDGNSIASHIYAVTERRFAG